MKYTHTDRWNIWMDYYLTQLVLKYTIKGWENIIIIPFREYDDNHLKEWHWRFKERITIEQ